MNRKERRAKARPKGRHAGPADAEGLFRAGVAHQQAGRPAEALALYRRVLTLRPEAPEVLHQAGVAAYELGRFAEAAELIGQAVTGAPDRPEFHNNLGSVLQKLDRAADAEAAFHAAIRLAPGYAEAHYNLGNLLRRGGRPEEAVDAYRRALTTRPNDAQVHHNLGLALHGLGRINEAAHSLARAVEIRPDHVDALLNLGNVLRQQGRPAAAISRFRQALALRPGDLGTLLCLAETREQQSEWEDALELFQEIVAVDAAHLRANAGRLRMLEHLCDWDGAAGARAAVHRAAAAERGEPAAEDPFETASREMDPAALFRSAQARSRAIATAMAPLRALVAAADRPQGDGRIRIGYLSSDFRDHAIGHLISGLFARHDHERFRITGYSTGADDGSVYRRTVAEGCDAFVDLRAAAPVEAARSIRGDGIDILVDLNGHTAQNRLDIPALRPAPVQVTYLGFPGTTGADFIDYILADAVVAPTDHAAFFSEKIIHLPHTYQVNGPQAVAAQKPTRASCGLPDASFVFCSFCLGFKIEPVMFGVWMDILSAVDRSVLWLFPGNPTAEANLRRQAEVRGIAPERLVFAGRLPKDRHLARIGLADLALDTRIYGGHTTTSDMLWAGIPVVSPLGDHFPSRVGASILKAAGLGDLVAASLEDYRAHAIRLAGDPAALAAVRARVAACRQESPLFDTARFARDLETAYARMWVRHTAGLPSAAFAVEKR